MEQFPDYLKIINGFKEKTETKTLRSEYDDGYIKQTRQVSKLRKTYALTYHACDGEHYASFCNWHKNNIDHGAKWFTWLNPKTNLKQLARIIEGDYDAESDENNNYENKLDGAWRISLSIETLE